MNISVLDGYALNPGDLSWDELGKLGHLKVYDRTPSKEIIHRAKDSDVLIINKTVLDASTLSELPNLKYIGVTATGYNIVDIEEAHRRGITVTNIPAYSTMSVAQHVFALLLAVTDHVEHYASEVKDGYWTRAKDFCFTDTPLIELYGKTIGIVGYGNIGKAVAKIADAFGMKVIVFTSKRQQELPSYCEKRDLENLFQISDVISLHCPLTPETKEMINTHTIGKMKEGVILINTGRGQLIDEKAMAEALQNGKIGAFCADVLSSEPPSESNPLLKDPNTYITPHIAWATKEARKRLMEITVSNLRNYLEGNPTNRV